MRLNRRFGLLVAGALALVVAAPALAGSAVASAAKPDGPAQLTAAAPPNEEPARDLCAFLRQLNPDEQKYRNTNNVPFTYTVDKFGTDWFDVACGNLSFSVPAGRQALVDLTAVAELDCQSAVPASNSWCGGRFLVNGAPVNYPDNTGRSDSYAWDSANGGAEDWQANTLAEEYVTQCPQNPTGAPCGYRVQLQSRLENGASSVWIDDLTIRVDVTEGPVTIASGPTTP